MKKTISIILAAAMMMSLASCKKKTETSPSPSPSMPAASVSPAAGASAEPAAANSAAGSNATEVPLNGGSLNEENAVGVKEQDDVVTVTYPKDFFDPSTNVDITEEMSAQGYKTVSKNADGSITYTITKDGYAKLKDKTKNSVIDYFNSVKSGEEFKSIKNIEYTDDFSTITMTVDREAFEKSLDVTASRAIYMLVSGYKIFCGEETNNAKVTIVYVDQKTKEEISRTVYPDALSK